MGLCCFLASSRCNWMETLHVEAVKFWVVAAVANTCETSESDSRAFCTVLLLMCPCIVCTQCNLDTARGSYRA